MRIEYCLCDIGHIILENYTHLTCKECGYEMLDKGNEMELKLNDFVVVKYEDVTCETTSHDEYIGHRDYAPTWTKEETEEIVEETIYGTIEDMVQNTEGRFITINGDIINLEDITHIKKFPLTKVSGLTLGFE